MNGKVFSSIPTQLARADTFGSIRALCNASRFVTVKVLLLLHLCAFDAAMRVH